MEEGGGLLKYSKTPYMAALVDFAVVVVAFCAAVKEQGIARSKLKVARSINDVIA